MKVWKNLKKLWEKLSICLCFHGFCNSSKLSLVFLDYELEISIIFTNTLKMPRSGGHFFKKGTLLLLTIYHSQSEKGIRDRVLGDLW